MGLFNMEKTNYVGEMREIVRDYMIKYIKDNPNASDIVVPIFSNAELMIRGLSEKQISKMLKQNCINVECGVLNIIQNFAMTELKPTSTANLIKNENHALDLYNYINKLKFERKYIDKKQFDENELLGIKLSLQSPLGMW